MFERFEDRKEGGRALAAKLSDYQNRKDVIVLALPRGGVPVAFEIAQALGAPLDIFAVRKLGVPGQEELAFGAIASDGVAVINESLVRALNLPEAAVQRVIEKEQRELERREKLYRAGRSPIQLAGQTVILVDDGLATGATMRVAIAAVRSLNPKQIIAAAPVASQGVCAEIQRKTEALCLCSIHPEPFYGVGMWYRNFDQTTDEEVRHLLALADNREQRKKSVG